MSDASNADSSNVGSFQSVEDASNNPAAAAAAANTQDPDDLSSVSGAPSHGVPFALYRTASGQSEHVSSTARA